MANIGNIIAALIGGGQGLQENAAASAVGGAYSPPAAQPQAPQPAPQQPAYQPPSYQPPSSYMPSAPQAAPSQNPSAPQIPQLPPLPPLPPASPGQGAGVLGILSTLLGSQGNKDSNDNSQQGNQQQGPLPAPSSGGTPVQIALPPELPSSGGQAPFPGPRGGPVPIQNAPQPQQPQLPPQRPQLTQPIAPPPAHPPQVPQGGVFSIQQMAAAIKAKNPNMSDTQLGQILMHPQVQNLLNQEGRMKLAQAHQDLQQKQLEMRTQERQEDRGERREFHEASIKERQNWHAGLEKRDQREFKSLKTDYDNATRRLDTLTANPSDPKKMAKAEEDFQEARKNLNEFGKRTGAPGHFGAEPQDESPQQGGGEGTQQNPIMAQTQDDIDNAPSGSVISVDGQLFTKP